MGLTIVLALLLGGLVPNASADVVCNPSETFQTIGIDGWRYEFTCGKHFDAILVEAQNDNAGTTPAIPVTPAEFTACLLDADGIATTCETGCGHLLLNRLRDVASVEVHVPKVAASSLCPALIGTVTVYFADE